MVWIYLAKDKDKWRALLNSTITYKDVTTKSAKFLYWSVELSLLKRDSALLNKVYWLREAPTSLTFNKFRLCPPCSYVFCIYLTTNSDLCHLQHKLIGFYNRDEKCLQRGTDWVFK
jgi:hypothetical protein